MLQDLHIHTIFSDGTDEIENILSVSKQNNIEIGIADHIYCKKLVSIDSILDYFSILARYPVFKGAEFDIGKAIILDDRILSISDYVIGSIHCIDIDGEVINFGKYFDSRAENKVLNSNYIFDDYVCCKALEIILEKIRKEVLVNPIDIIGHCTVNPFYEQVNSKFRFEWENALISICESSHIALEISGLWIEPDIDLIQKAINKNVKLTFGSDCHTPYSMSYLDYFKFVKNNLNLSEGDFKRFGKE